MKLYSKYPWNPLVEVETATSVTHHAAHDDKEAYAEEAGCDNE